MAPASATLTRAEVEERFGPITDARLNRMSVSQKRALLRSMTEFIYGRKLREARRQQAEAYRALSEVRELQEKVRERREVAKDFAVRYLQMAEKTRKISYAARMNGGVAVVSVIRGAFGAILTILGFGLWYSRVQKYEDMKLRQEAEGLRANAAEIQSAPVEAGLLAEPEPAPLHVISSDAVTPAARALRGGDPAESAAKAS
jgi:hypothetical protein